MSNQFPNIKYIYLHGFASSPNSVKAQYIHQYLAKKQISLIIPDLNEGDFYNLTLSRQIKQVAQIFSSFSTPIILIGSSFGGLTATYLGEQYKQIQALVLLAPAFGFYSRFIELLGEDQLKKWQTTGSLSIYHYGQQKNCLLNYTFLTDLNQYQEENCQRSLPTLIIQGKEDEVIPIEKTRSYASKRPWVQLIELDSEHGMTESLPEICSEISKFFSTLS